MSPNSAIALAGKPALDRSKYPDLRTVPDHLNLGNHWHTADDAKFEVRQGGPTGTVVGGNSIKVGFCRVDDEPDRRVPRTGQDEQHGVGEVHAVDRLHREPKGTVTDHSPCESPGMCGELSPNR